MRFIIFVFICLFCTTSAHATMVELPIEEVMSSRLAKQNLTSDIQFHFGKQRQNGKEIGTWVSNKKTNKVGKGTKESCYRAFVSAMISLQNRALKENGSKVVNIHSYYKKVPFYSDEYFKCEVGNIMSGVALRGTVLE